MFCLKFQSWCPLISFCCPYYLFVLWVERAPSQTEITVTLIISWALFFPLRCKEVILAETPAHSPTKQNKLSALTSLCRWADEVGAHCLWSLRDHRLCSLIRLAQSHHIDSEPHTYRLCNMNHKQRAFIHTLTNQDAFFPLRARKYLALNHMRYSLL